MTATWVLIGGLSAATFAIRLGGVLLGARLPRTGGWAAAFQALPGCLITALLTVLLLQGGVPEWLAAGVALAVAALFRSLPLTMVAGIGAIWALRHLL